MDRRRLVPGPAVVPRSPYRHMRASLVGNFQVRKHPTNSSAQLHLAEAHPALLPQFHYDDRHGVADHGREAPVSCRGGWECKVRGFRGAGSASSKDGAGGQITTDAPLFGRGGHLGCSFPSYRPPLKQTIFRRVRHPGSLDPRERRQLVEVRLLGADYVFCLHAARQ